MVIIGNDNSDTVTRRRLSAGARARPGLRSVSWHHGRADADHAENRHTPKPETFLHVPLPCPTRDGAEVAVSSGLSE